MEPGATSIQFVFTPSRLWSFGGGCTVEVGAVKSRRLSLIIIDPDGTAGPRGSARNDESGVDARELLAESHERRREAVENAIVEGPSLRTPSVGSPIFGTDCESWVWRLAVC